MIRHCAVFIDSREPLEFDETYHHAAKRSSRRGGITNKRPRPGARATMTRHAIPRVASLTRALHVCKPVQLANLNSKGAPH